MSKFEKRLIRAAIEKAAIAPWSAECYRLRAKIAGLEVALQWEKDARKCDNNTADKIIAGYVATAYSANGQRKWS